MVDIPKDPYSLKMLDVLARRAMLALLAQHRVVQRLRLHHYDVGQARALLAIQSSSISLYALSKAKPEAEASRARRRADLTAKRIPRQARQRPAPRPGTCWRVPSGCPRVPQGRREGAKPRA